MHRSPARRSRHRCAAAALTAFGVAACGGAGADPAATGRPIHVVAVAAQTCRLPQRARGLGVAVEDGLVVDDRTDLALLPPAAGGAFAVTAVAFATGAVTPARAAVHAAEGRLPVVIRRTGPLVVNDVTDDTRHTREVDTFAPGAELQLLLGAAPAPGPPLGCDD